MQPRDAATVLLLRDARAGCEVFMVKRHGASGFMADAHVFPGGKLDGADCAPELFAHVQGHDGESAKRALAEPHLAPGVALGLFIAGVRETFEEAGVLLCRGASPSELAKARERLHQGDSFAEVLANLRVTLALDELVPLSRWITPTAEPRRFDTRFFLARAPEAQLAQHDTRETTEGAWLTPEQAIRRMREGTIMLPPPTLRSLEWLSACENVTAALAKAASTPPPRIEPTIEHVDGKLAIILPGDPLHPESQRALEGSTRMVLENGRFWSK